MRTGCPAAGCHRRAEDLIRAELNAGRARAENAAGEFASRFGAAFERHASPCTLAAQLKARRSRLSFQVRQFRPRQREPDRACNARHPRDQPRCSRLSIIWCTAGGLRCQASKVSGVTIVASCDRARRPSPARSCATGRSAPATRDIGRPNRLSVRSPRIASTATVALNFGLYCLRVVVIAPPAFTTPPNSILLPGLKSWDHYRAAIPPLACHPQTVLRRERSRNTPYS